LGFHHFSFGAPEYLFALLLVPLFLVFASYVRRRRARYTAAFTNLETLAGVRALRGWHWRRRTPLVLLALALAACATAIAKPRIETSASDQDTTIVLLADTSGSMAATDIVPARIFAAVNAMKELTAALPKRDKIGLVTVADKVQINVPPTTDHGAIDSALDVLTPEGGTALGEGIEAAVNVVVSTLAASGAHHVPGEFLPAAIVLLSDGSQDRGSVTASAAAELAKEAGVRIYGVALGTRHGVITQGHGLVMQEFPVPPDPGAIALLARASGGEAFNATTAGSLNTIYRDLGSSIGHHKVDTDIASWFDLAAVVFLVAGVAAARVLGPTLP
jgi:Ca-activated chloride channel homolog